MYDFWSNALALNIAEQTGIRGNLLENVNQMLLTVPPTSVEAKRVFSSCFLSLQQNFEAVSVIKF